MVTQKIKRPLLGLASLVLVVASVVPTIGQKAHAYGLLGTRYIKMGTSQLGATDVNYEIGFNVATPASVGGLVVQFCQNSPIIGDGCTAPTGFDINKAGVAIAQTGLSGFTISATPTNANTLVLTNATPQALAANAPVTVTLGSTGSTDGVNNPTDNDTVTAGNQPGTFYARILTYDNATDANAYTPTAAGGGTGVIDAGGIALSTASQITITSKVQERLAFCVYTAANCAGGGSAITLGDTNGVLDPSGPFVDKNTKFDVSTNASQGVDIRVKGDTLSSGSFTINPIGATPATVTAGGTEQFGLCLYQSTGSGLTPDNLYDGDASGTTSTACSGTTQTAGTATTGGDNNAAFAFDNNNTTGTMSTYGQIIATKAAGSNSQATIPFAADISNTTEAGIYTTTLTFIATGKY